jgi:hypothetical protein
VRSSVHDSNGPNIRVRGNAYQVMEKYLAMARDAAAAGDRIAAENYYQHAEHYFRTLNASGANGSGEHRHHMNTPSDPMGGMPEDGDFDEDYANGRQGGGDQRPMTPNPGQQARPADPSRAEAPRPDPSRIDPARAEQPRVDMPPMAAPGAPQPYESRGHGDHDQRRRGPNGRRRGFDGQRHGQGHHQGGPQRDPRSISPASPAEAANTENDPADPDKPIES